MKRKKPTASAPANQLQIGMQLALAKHQAGQIQAAADHYRVILSLAPDLPDALHYLGVAEHQLGRPNEAARLIDRAVTLAPSYVDAHNNLGNVYKELGELTQAEKAYRAAIAVRPQFVMAHNNLGVVLAKQERFDEAIASYQQAVTLKDDFADAWHNLGNTLKKAGLIEDALTAYRRAIELAPYTPGAYQDLGRALAISKRFDEALMVYKQWHALDPNNPVIEHMIAAYEGESRLSRASDGYVQATFNSFAESFDEVLAHLDYQAPALTGELVAAILVEPAATLQVLDAGCGTGLCAPYLKPYAATLVGVDLSEGMLAQAALRHSYDRLDQAELTVYLGTHLGQFDLIVSADTLCYFGALQDVLTAAAQALRPGGHLIFTVEERGADCSPGYTLQHHGRYTHSVGYVNGLLESTGLSIKAMSQVTLRTESDLPVKGLLVAAHRAWSQA
ncbi:tetratricopeptide repeat protein [Roseateles oligotrophus]|uniref:Tetratricopeptide repeat protein n=1 Tax=Roseateles oligotrophus TaxID=1769250 RepID=A0ABT2YG70_9BURK|nr:tetratricopeptide repeat protein [Roseateles oligotrophus]MCV2369053.1 tetratricopeptide repeat protein [Roseateles oligotrophus]